jgi:hypothetical protein
MTNTTSTAQSVSAQTGVAPSSLEFFDFLKTQNNELISIIKKTNDELLKLLKSPSPSPSSSSSSSSSPPPPPPPPSPSPSPSYSFESADGVQLSEKNSPWKTSFSEPCYICGYFGHGHKQCPNILEQFRGSCLKCYGAGHVAEDCVNAAREPPMRSGFKKPTSFCS